MELQGTVKTVGAVEEFGTNGFKKAKVMLDRTESFQGQTYENYTEVVFLGKNTELIEERNIAPGDYVKVTGNLQGRFFQHEGKEKHAQDFVGFKLEVVRKYQTPENTPQPQSQTDGLV